MEIYEEKYKVTGIDDTARECPFCGSTRIMLVEIEKRGGGKYYEVSCAHCGASIEDCFFKHPWEAINAWNGGDEGRYCDRKDRDGQ